MSHEAPRKRQHDQGRRNPLELRFTQQDTSRADAASQQKYRTEWGYPLLLCDAPLVSKEEGHTAVVEHFAGRAAQDRLAQS